MQDLLSLKDNTLCFTQIIDIHNFMLSCLSLRGATSLCKILIQKFVSIAMVIHGV